MCPVASYDEEPLMGGLGIPSRVAVPAWIDAVRNGRELRCQGLFLGLSFISAGQHPCPVADPSATFSTAISPFGSALSAWA